MRTQKLLPSLEAALRSAGIDPYAPVKKSGKLREDAANLMRQAKKMVERIPPGQPIGSIRDRNLRDRSWEKIRKANELIKEAEKLESSGE